MVFFVLTGGLSGTFSNLLIPLQIGARDMASGFLNMLSYWFFAVSSVIMIFSLFVEGGAASGGWTVYPPAKCVASGDAWLWLGHDVVVDFHDLVRGELVARRIELHRDCD
jgi:heme/copper-type cytochrome/quinol oxidase subunit 1